MVLLTVLVILQLRGIFNFLRLLLQFKGEHMHNICFLVELLLLVFQLPVRVLSHFFEAEIIVLVTVLLLKELEFGAFQIFELTHHLNSVDVDGFYMG
tara:strand:+ start:1246 stop:1536 length:291 start_codon:yes stop_codon:yes gene_type:complete